MNILRSDNLDISKAIKKWEPILDNRLSPDKQIIGDLQNTMTILKNIIF